MHQCNQEINVVAELEVVHAAPRLLTADELLAVAGGPQLTNEGDPD